MGLSEHDVVPITRICAKNKNRVSYGVLGAAIMTRVGHPAPSPGSYGQATAGHVSANFNPCPVASWVVRARGAHRGFPPVGLYGLPPNPPNTRYDTAWTVNTPFHTSVQLFLDWLDRIAPGWDANLQSTYP
jgi:hypothetical protein